MSTILTNYFVYDQYTFSSTALALDLSSPFIYLFVDEKLLIALFLSLTNFFVNHATNCRLLFEITLLDNLCNFHTLFLNNLTNLSTVIFSVITIKYNIFKNLSHTTKIESWLLDTGNFIFKSTNCYDSRLKELSDETTLILSNTRELNRVPNTK